jgi:DNA-binding CsgD family transcriptional regulator
MRLQTSMAAALSLERTSLNLSAFPVAGLFSALDNFKIGVSLFDRRLRYTAVSRALAAFTKLPVEAHPGKAMHEVVDAALVKTSEPSFEHVFSTGQSLPNLRRSGQLLTRPGEILHWLSYYFPLLDNRGRVAQVGVIMMELDSKPGPANQEVRHTNGRILHSEATDHSKFANAREAGVTLSTRERQVLTLLAEGKPNKEISSILAISVKTVETYRSRVMLKINAPSLIHLVHYAIRHNFVDIQG